MRGSPKDFPFVELNDSAKVAILCHRRADVDAYCSAFVVSRLLKRIQRGVNVVIAAHGGLNVLARRVQTKFRTEVVEELSLRDLDLVIVVDTGNLSLLAEWGNELKDSRAIKVFVDHHPLEEKVEQLADFFIVDEAASSTSEITCDIFEAKGFKTSRAVAQAMLTGLLFDSQHLRLADCRTIWTVGRLCEQGVCLGDSRELLKLPRRSSENIARLKAAQRLKIFTAGKWIIATTILGSYRASAARALLDVGSDVAFAFEDGRTESKGSIRASQRFYRNTGIHLGVDLAAEGASIMGGEGGGHPTAASFVAKATPLKARDTILRLLSERIHEDICEIR